MTASHRRRKIISYLKSGIFEITRSPDRNKKGNFLLIKKNCFHKCHFIKEVNWNLNLQAAFSSLEWSIISRKQYQSYGIKHNFVISTDFEFYNQRRMCYHNWTTCVLEDVEVLFRTSIKQLRKSKPDPIPIQHWQHSWNRSLDLMCAALWTLIYRPYSSNNIDL